MKKYTTDYIKRYGTAVFSVLVILFLTRYVFGDSLIRSSIMLFLFAVLLSARFGGLGPSILALVLSLVLYLSLILPQLQSMRVDTGNDLVRMLIFVGVGISISFFTVRLKQAEEAAREKKEWLEVTLGSIGEAVIVSDETHRIVEMNKVAEEITQWPKKEALCHRIQEVFQIIDERSGEKIADPLMCVMKDSSPAGTPVSHLLLVTRDGRRTPIECNGAGMHDVDGNQIGATLVFRDITGRRLTERKLEDTATRLKLAMEAGHLLAFDWNLKTASVDWMGSLEKNSPIPGEWLPDSMVSLSALIYEDDRRQVNEKMNAALAGDSSFSAEFRLGLEPETTRWVGAIGKIFYDDHGDPLRMLGVFMDVHEMKIAEQQIANQLKEKEILLQEVHHRVKNNLQIVSSLLSLQSGSSADIAAKSLFRESQSRLQSMALIHEKLYQSKDLSKIDLGEYVKDLMNNLYSAYGIDNKRIMQKIECDEVHVTLDKAIPAGMILNEVISNALKHAFPGDRSGFIRVHLHCSDGKARMEIEDDGTGMPAGVDLTHFSTLGLRLISSLVTQLKGNIQLEREKGTMFKIEFSL